MTNVSRLDIKISYTTLFDIRIRSNGQINCNRPVIRCSHVVASSEGQTRTKESTIQKADNLEFTGESHFVAA